MRSMRSLWFHSAPQGGRLADRAAPLTGGLLAAAMVIMVLTPGCPPSEVPTPAFVARPMQPYLTWQGDPCTTITIDYQTAGPFDGVGVYSAPEGDSASSERATTLTHGTSHQISGLADGRYVHSVELTGLLPGARYRFSIVGADVDASPDYTFRTIPDDDTARRFVCGGDMGTSDVTVELLRQAAALDPEFAVIGGDLAYANGDLLNVDRWDTWLNNWFDTMVTGEGDLIPMVLAIGNHETNELPAPPACRAPFYFGFFPQGGSAHFVRDFGPNLSLTVLDTGHLSRYGGTQKAWLADTLRERETVPWNVAVYHVPLYPSHRGFNEPQSVAGRLHWQPIFDRYGLDLAFENHDHTLKRTVPLRGGVYDPAGTVYLGDGCFGKDPRTVCERWYLAHSASTAHVWFVEADPDHLRAAAIDQYGQVVDEVERSP